MKSQKKKKDGSQLMVCKVVKRKREQINFEKERSVEITRKVPKWRNTKALYSYMKGKQKTKNYMKKF